MTEPGRLFVYGTLQHPDVMRQVIGRVPPFRKAIARDCARRRLKGQCFPGMFISSGENTPGLVYESLTPEDWLRLDDYEGHIYQRTPVTVDFSDGTPSARIDAYLLNSLGLELVEEAPWSYENFLQNDLEEYLAGE